MGSGGARTRSGPPPDPAALRRKRATDAGWTTLPAEGRKGLPPVWPLSPADGDQAAREVQLWQRLWASPQAVQWERQQLVLEVALYVRRLYDAEQPGSPAASGNLAKQMADALGLTIPGMRTNRWKIAVDEVTEKRDQATAPAGPSRPSARSRFRVVRDETGG